jgi:predicted O-methyltransferase YrrM
VSATFIDVLHSPFVFQLYNDCIARKTYPTELKPIDILWNRVSRSNEIIEQVDFGANGHLHTSRKNKASYYARKHAKSKRIAYILHRLVKYNQYQYCIELGTSLGYSTLHIASALPKQSLFTTIEGAPAIAQLAKQHLTLLQLNQKAQVITGKFDEMLPSVLEMYPQVDFAFIDGNHTYEATLRHFNTLLPKKHNNSVFVFDDIYWSDGMTRAWNEIKKHPEVKVTVDLFFIGLVFFRKEQRKQDFSLRIW